MILSVCYKLGMNKRIITGKWLKGKRFQLELNQKQLAEKLDIPPQTYNNYERYKTMPPGWIILKVFWLTTKEEPGKN